MQQDDNPNQMPEVSLDVGRRKPNSSADGKGKGKTHTGNKGGSDGKGKLEKIEFSSLDFNGASLLESLRHSKFVLGLICVFDLKNISCRGFV